MSRSLIMARTEDRESEPVIVNTDNPKVVVLELDDGKTLALDSTEIRAAVEPRKVAA